MVEKYVPKLGNLNVQWSFPLQFEKANLDKSSLASTPIEYYDYEGAKLQQHATGIFIKHAGQVYLVTARHALSGTDVFTDASISPTGYRPKTIAVYPTYLGKDGLHRCNHEPTKLSVRDNDDQPLWFEDPLFDELRTDIACLKMDDKSAAEIEAISSEVGGNIFSHVGMSCFVIGFPSSAYFRPFLPIWRRASFASELRFPIDDKPIFLVDANTSPGMSGSAIWQYSYGPKVLHDGRSGFKVELDAVIGAKFVGIYGGRLATPDEMGPIGYGWYANRIPVIIESQCLGRG